jgi:beta-lactamase class A
MRRALAVIMLVVLSACSAGSTSSTTTVVPVETTTVADTLRGQVDWFVNAINGTLVSEAEYEQRMSETFRSAVPFATQFEPVVEQMAAVPGSWIIVSYDEVSPTNAVAVIAAGTERARISLSVDPDVPHVITGLLVSPADSASAPDTFENAFSRLGALGTLRALAAEVVGGECRSIAEVDPDTPAPLGSVFKLYVLGALQHQVSSGVIGWDDPVTIRDELKSVPSGILQNDPAGTVKPVHEVADLMISISDNTATDHLIDLIGRSTIEGLLGDLGLSHPEVDIPFLDTRELTALKVGPSAGLGAQYVNADEAGKRAILAQISDISASDLPVADLTDPVMPETLEWFASAADLCTTMVRLWDVGDGTTRAILTKNPGVAPAPGLWTDVAFKGGSEPGLVAVAWLMHRPDGRSFFFAGSVVNAKQTIDQMEAVFLFAGARDLLATQD